MLPESQRMNRHFLSIHSPSLPSTFAIISPFLFLKCFKAFLLSMLSHSWPLLTPMGLLALGQPFCAAFFGGLLLRQAYDSFLRLLEGVVPKAVSPIVAMGCAAKVVSPKLCSCAVRWFFQSQNVSYNSCSIITSWVVPMTGMKHGFSFSPGE